MKAFPIRFKPILYFTVSCLFAGCFVRSGTITQTTAYPKLLVKGRKEKKYMVMHSGLDTFAITDVQVARAKRQFTVHLARPDSVHLAALRNPALRTGKYMYVFMRDSASYTLDEPHTIPLERIARIELPD